MCQIRAGAVAGEEAFRQVSIFRQDRAVLVEEFEDVLAVVVLRRVPVLRREAVVDGDDDGGDLPAEPPADGVVG